MISLLLHKTDWAEIITVENIEMLKKKKKKKIVTIHIACFGRTNSPALLCNHISKECNIRKAGNRVLSIFPCHTTKDDNPLS